MPLWLTVWAVLVVGALLVLGVLGWRVFTKAKALFISLSDAVSDAHDAGDAASNWHRQWADERRDADDRYEAELRESSRPGPKHALPGTPQKG